MLSDGPASCRELARAVRGISDSSTNAGLVERAVEALAPVSVEGLRAELDDWASTKLGEAEAGAPAGLAVRAVKRSGHVGHEIVAEIESGGYDLVVLGSRGHARVTAEILGSVNAHVHYHVKVPTLTIDAAEPSEGGSEDVKPAGS